MYATARDWARFGLLYLHDGIWEGKRILPEGWVDYTVTPTPNVPKGSQYGAHFGLNLGEEDRWMPELPPDAYFMLGHECQVVVIIPSRKLVVVRLGRNPNSRFQPHLLFIADILRAISKDD